MAWETLEALAKDVLNFLVFLLIFFGILGGIAHWVEKLMKRREILAYMEKERLKAELKS